MSLGLSEIAICILCGFLMFIENTIILYENKDIAQDKITCNKNCYCKKRQSEITFHNI